MVRVCCILCPLLLVAGCQRPEVPGARGADRFDTSTVRPLRLVYRAEHRGDHPPWRYQAHVSIEDDTHDGQPIWRHTLRIEDEDPQGAEFEATTRLHRDTLALLEVVEVYGGAFGSSRTLLAVRGDRLAIERVADGETTAIEIAAPGFVVYDLDLPLIAMPLREGYRTELDLVDLINYDDPRVRRFSVSVERQETVDVPAGQFDAWRVAIEPRDGNRRLAATYHVRTSSPRVVLRKRYVVNPETVGAVRRSIGTEELASLEVR